MGGGDRLHDSQSHGRASGLADDVLCRIRRSIGFTAAPCHGWMDPRCRWLCSKYIGSLLSERQLLVQKPGWSAGECFWQQVLDAPSSGCKLQFRFVSSLSLSLSLSYLPSIHSSQIPLPHPSRLYVRPLEQSFADAIGYERAVLCGCHRL
jgi:hypothetical protein